MEVRLLHQRGGGKAGGGRVIYVWEGGEFYRGCLKFIESRMIV
jgi:hypothetical protein